MSRSLCSAIKGLSLTDGGCFYGGDSRLATRSVSAAPLSDDGFCIEAAHKKGAGSTKNGRDSISKRRGVKVYGMQKVKAGGIIIRQVGTKVISDHHLTSFLENLFFCRFSFILARMLVLDATIQSLPRKKASSSSNGERNRENWCEAREPILAERVRSRFMFRSRSTPKIIQKSRPSCQRKSQGIGRRVANDGWHNTHLVPFKGNRLENNRHPPMKCDRVVIG